MYKYRHSISDKIESLSEEASVNAGTSYEDYIDFFSASFDKNFKNASRLALSIAFRYGYTMKKDRG